MNKTLENLIREGLKSIGVEAKDVLVEHPANPNFGDYSTNAAIKYGHKDELVRYIETNLPEGVERVEAAGPGFINFYLSKDFYKKSIGEILEKGEEFGNNESLNGKKYFIEHTQPNPFKAFHIGHLMNNSLGEAISRIVKANGAEVKTASYHGDVGLHVAKAVYGGDYASGHKAYEESEEAKEKIHEINKKIYEKSDEEINRKYEEGRRESLEKFGKIYEKLGSKFDFNFFESETGPLGREIVEANVGKIFEESDGAIVYKGEKVGLHTRVFLSSEKLPTYETKEVGLAQIKKEKYPFDSSLTVTANEQDAFFQVTEAAIGEVFPELKGKLHHLSHGMLRLPSGKMSSRTGDVITAEELIEEVKGKTQGNEDVAIGAIKYMILRQAIGNDIIFDIEKSVSTEGDSGVYLQYAHARAASLLDKAGKKGDPSGERENVHEVEKLLYRFPEVVERAQKEYAPNYITTYLTELAASFNNFYAHEEVIGSREEPYKLALVEAFKIVMRNGLNILGIPSPERI